MFARARGKKPGLEILGPWLLNKGDVLNIHAIARRLGSRFCFGVSSNLGLDALPADPPLLRIKWRPGAEDFLSAVRKPSLQRSLGLARRSVALRMVPSSILDRRRIIDGRHIIGLLDCSGFAYGDQWNPQRIQGRARYYRWIKDKGARLILLPQAFGPFTRQEVRAATQEALSQFHLIYARDRVSYDHLLTLDLDASRIGISPDITHLLEVDAPADKAEWADRVCIVPNERMKDRTADTEGVAYVRVLRLCIQRTLEAGFRPCFVIHEANDRPLVGHLNDSLAAPLPVYDEDALATKGYLGSCQAVIGSRYHALLSSLAQGTPCLGTSWNHKYEQMFSDYGCPEMLLSATPADAEIEDKLTRLFSQQDARSAFIRSAALLKARVEQMWRQVEQSLRPELTT